ncbi:MAG: DUF354 domain-containing protein [Candidatus Pacebacteria bacterium]|nr:DUF354 domain-containing protein [Candidatus Paceibacterota bacterium]
MHILFDIIHPAHINFYKNLVQRLDREGHRITMLYLQRGAVPRIMREEFGNYAMIPAGKHAKSTLGLYFKTGLLRTLSLACKIARLRPDASFTVAGFQTDFLSRIFRYKSISAYDDPGHINFTLSRRFAHRFVLPDCLQFTGQNIIPFKGLKEWAYLSPTYFRPDIDTLQPYDLKPKDYIFIRNVDTGTLNYRSQTEDIILQLYTLGLNRQNVVLSLEDKDKRKLFSEWLILDEPVPDIHSLMFYSRLVLANGDSMAREAAQLGVPSVYCGQRQMPANQLLIDMDIMRHITRAEDILQLAERETFDGDSRTQEIRRDELLNTWDDPTEILYHALLDLTQANGK